jgi:hypothetical protein
MFRSMNMHGNKNSMQMHEVIGNKKDDIYYLLNCEGLECVSECECYPPVIGNHWNSLKGEIHAHFVFRKVFFLLFLTEEWMMSLRKFEA